MYGLNSSGFSDAYLCNYVKETLEAKHKVVIEGVEQIFGVFEFRVKAIDIGNQPIPFRWTPVAFGDGSVTFRITQEEFEANYQKLEEEDLESALRSTFPLVHKEVELVSIEEIEDPMLDNEGYELVVRLKPGRKYVNDPWMSLMWVKGDLMAFEAGYEELRSMIEYLNEHNNKHRS